MTTKNERPPSNYSSPVRDEAKQATRDRIIRALVDVVLNEGIHAFSVATVAAAAGVSHRTVYRHFASREELLEGLNDSMESLPTARVQSPGPNESMLDGAGAMTERMFHGLDGIRDQATAEFIIGVALRYNTRGKRERWARIQDEVRTRFPALSPEEQLEGAAALRALVSSNAWFHLRVQLDVPATQAARGVRRAIELVLADLKQRNDAQSTQPTEERDT